MADIYNYAGTDDVVTGTDGDDYIFSGGGNDVLYGGGGNDGLDGGWHDPYTSDTLYGGDGDDKLQGGKGDMANDVLSGGDGHDTFYFGSEGDDAGPYQGFGTDTITDFQVGVDKINVVAVHDVNKDYDPSTGEYNFLKFHVEGNDTHIDVYANAGEPDHGYAGTIVLQGVAVTDVHAFGEENIIAWPNPEYADF